MIQLLTTQISERSTPAEIAAAIRNLRDAVVEWQRHPLASAQFIRDVELTDAAQTPIAHNLGRPATVFVSQPKNAATAGIIDDITHYNAFDRRKFVTLVASGFGATITVDLIVVPL